MNGLISEVMDLVKEFSAHLREEHLSEQEPFFTLNGVSMEFCEIEPVSYGFEEKLTYLQYIHLYFLAVYSIMNIAVIALHYLFNQCIFFICWFFSCIVLQDYKIFPPMSLI